LDQYSATKYAAWVATGKTCAPQAWLAAIRNNNPVRNLRDRSLQSHGYDIAGHMFCYEPQGGDNAGRLQYRQGLGAGLFSRRAID